MGFTGNYGLYNQDCNGERSSNCWARGRPRSPPRHTGEQGVKCFCGSVGTARFAQLQNSYFLCVSENRLNP